MSPLLDPITKGAPVTQGRVKLEMPLLADNGNSVSMRVSVESPMTEADHVRAVHLISERNPEARMASFHLGPRAGMATMVGVAWTLNRLKAVPDHFAAPTAVAKEVTPEST